MAFRSGRVALIGKPNVGKSTLLNRIVGQKVSIVSNKPQTTRRRVMGIANGSEWQIAFLDTPGVHTPHTTLGRAMVDQARSALQGIDLVVVVVDGAHHPGEQDEKLAEFLKAASVKRILCMNRMDELKAENVQRNVDAYSSIFGTGESFMMTTATRGTNVDLLVGMIVEALPERAPEFDPDEFTDQSMRFMTAEVVREKVLQLTRQEVPHATAVTVTEWEESEDKVEAYVEIVVEKASQKGILIGKGGEMLGKIREKAAPEVQELLGKPVALKLHVKVEEGWRMSPRLLHELDYEG